MTIAADGRLDILMATLRHVPFDGWTMRALEHGARDAGYDAAGLARAYPGGVSELVSTFSTWADAAMIDALAAQDLGEMRTRAKIALAVRLRFEVLAPYRESVRRLNAYFALPGKALLAARLVAWTVDAIWRAAGDSSTDFSYYTKRGLLAAAYGATALYWLSDDSEGSQASWDFLDRRLDGILRLPQLGQGAERLLAHVPSPLRLIRLASRRGPV